MKTIKDELYEIFNALHLTDYEKEHVAFVVFKDLTNGLYNHIYTWELFVQTFGEYEYALLGFKSDSMPDIDIYGISEDGETWLVARNLPFDTEETYKFWKAFSLETEAKYNPIKLMEELKKAYADKGKENMRILQTRHPLSKKEFDERREEINDTPFGASIVDELDPYTFSLEETMAMVKKNHRIDAEVESAMYGSKAIHLD